MGTVCCDYWTSGRSRQQFARETVRTAKPTHRRKVLPIGDDGVRVCRHSSVLLQRVERTESEQERHRPTTPGMDCAEGDYSSTTPETSDVFDSSTLHVPARSSEYGRGSIVYGMSSLSVRPTVIFSANVTVHKFIDRAPDARNGPWIQHAVDRH